MSTSPGPDDGLLPVGRPRPRSLSLSPLRDRPVSPLSPGVVPTIPENELPVAVPEPVPVPVAVLGPSAQPTLNQVGGNLVLTVEHMDTAINAHASVIAEGIRPPLEKRSSIDGLKSLFRSSSQVGFPTLQDMLVNDVQPFTKESNAPSSDSSQKGIAKPRPESTSTQASGASQTPTIGTPPNLATFSAKMSGSLRKVFPQDSDTASRKNSVAPFSHDAVRQAVLPQPVDPPRVVTVVPEVDSTPPTSGQTTPRLVSKGEGKDVLLKRRSSISRISDNAQALARQASKLLDRTLMDELDETRQAKVAELMEKDVMVLNENQLAKMQQRSAHPFTISVESSFRRWWDLVIALCTAYVVITMPIKVGFAVTTRGFVFAIDILVDLLYALEIPLNMFTSYFDESTGEEVKPLKSIRHNYIYGYFIVDAMSCFPVSMLSDAHPMLSLSKTLKVARVSKFSKSGIFKVFSSRVNRTMNPSMLRMLELTFIFFFSQHFIACTYYYISQNQRELTSWQVPDETRHSALIHQYIHAFYFAILVTTANDVDPTTTTEKLFTSVMLFVGIVINASIIGSAANLLSNLDKAEIARKNQMDNINDYMRFKKVPIKLQEKIRRYYDYALNGRITDPTGTLFAELPDRLKLSLRLSLHDEFIRKVPLFRVCSNAGVIAIIQCLRPVVAMPQEVIISQGEMANEFYFIKNGRVSLCVRLVAQEVPLGNLGEGSFFGESSLLTGEPQQAEVKSESISELAYLTKTDFLAIVEKFPTFYLAVRRISDNRMQTAQNVQRMTKMQRRQSHPFVNPMMRRLTLKKVAESVLRSASVRPSFRVGSMRFSERNGGSGGPAPLDGSRVKGADGSFVHLSQRFSSSRRESVSGLFSAHYMERISLGQARHLSTLQSLEGLEIANSNDDPLWN